VFQGTLLLVGVLGIWFCLILLPERFDDNQSTALRLVIGTIWIMWGTTWVGVWRLTCTPGRAHDSRHELIWRRALRISVSLYTLAPLFWWLRGSTEWSGAIAAGAVACLFAGLIATICLYQHVQHLARRVRHVPLQFIFGLAGGFCAATMALMLMFSTGRHWVDGGNFQQWLPSPVSGSPAYLGIRLGDLWAALTQPHPMVWAMMVTAILPVVAWVWFAFVIWRYHREAIGHGRASTLETAGANRL
jgi:hypothetical protein